MANDRNPRSTRFRRSPPNNSTRSPIQASDSVPPLGDQKDHPRQLNPNLQAIKGFLATRIGPVQKAEDHTTSDGTRPPALWDMHLDGLQTLRQVETDTNLNQQLSDLAKEKIDSAENDVAQEMNMTLFVDLQPCRDIDMVEVKDEDDLVDAYSEIIAHRCSRIASFLLGGGNWDRPIVHWCKKSLTTQSVAVADGYLCLDVASIKASSASASLKKILLLVAETFPELAVFEFKNLQLGTKKRVQALVDVANEATYDWVRCDPGECRKSHFVGGYSQTTCAPMGFDARSNLPFQYPKCQVVAKERKREREEAEEPCPRKPLSARSDDEVHARHVFQQVWAEAVARDTTFLIIRCGNHEIIGLRNRNTQTLHISGVIDLTATTGPTYLQVHVGLYIAAVLDAIQRALRLREASKMPQTWKEDWNKSKESSRTRIPAQDVLLARARDMPSVVLHSPTLYTPMDVKNPKFFRSGVHSDHPGSGGPVMQILKATLANNSERTYRATLQVMGHKIQTDVYLKLARTSANRLELLHEYDTCNYLAQKGISGVPDIIGCFSYTEKVDATHDIHILAMLSLGAGMPITQDDRAIPDTLVPLLQQIHDAGYLHGGIYSGHLLVDDRKAAMVSFGNASAYNSDGAAMEMQHLCSLLRRGRKRRRHHLFGDAEQVVVIEHSHILRNRAKVFVSLVLHVPRILEMFNDRTIQRVLYDEHAGGSRFIVQLEHTQDPSEFVYSWLDNLPDKLRKVRCEVQDVKAGVADSYGITKTAQEFTPEQLMVFASASMPR